MARTRAKVFVRGRRFLHPKLGFTFTAPENFTLDNTAQAVIGVREGGAQAMRFDVVRVPAEQTLGDYLNSGWMENVDKASTEDLTINGFPAASVTAHGDQWQFKVYALRFGSDVYRFIFAAKQKTTESDRNARETVNSFRRLTLEEIQAARPLRIKVINVQPGDTVESLSHRMAGRRPSGGALSHPQRARRPRPGQGARPRQDRGGFPAKAGTHAVHSLFCPGARGLLQQLTPVVMPAFAGTTR
jgi:predicted Zn-dependent protease